MRETRAYDRLKAMHPSAHWIRVEGLTTTGAHDCNACKDGIEIWVECKQVKKRVRSTTLIKPKVMRGQVPWEALRRQAGGMTYIAIMVGSDLYVIPGKYLKDLKIGMPLEVIKIVQLDPMKIFYKPVKT